MSFSCKIVLGDYQKEDGTRMVYLQAYIDRKRATVPLKFYLHEKDFDPRGQRVRSNNLTHESFNKELMMAIAKGNTIASNFRIENKRLTPELFRAEFTNPSGELDLIKFIDKALQLRRPTIAPNTYKQHTTVVNKLKSFRKVIPFRDVDVDLMQEFKNHLSKSNSQPTVNKLLKIIKQYLAEARIRDIKVSDPFKVVKIKNFKSNRVSLSEEELNRLITYYEKPDCPRSHKKLLRYFIFSCQTGVRISDIGVITWNNIHDDVLIFLPVKTKNNKLLTKVPLLDRDKKFLPEYKEGNKPIFETFSFPVSNRYLKKIAALEEVKIKKTITYHTARHTFGTLYIEGGGSVQSAQEMMGHGSITTTMGYVHTGTKSLVDAKKKRYEPDEKKH